MLHILQYSAMQHISVQLQTSRLWWVAEAVSLVFKSKPVLYTSTLYFIFVLCTSTIYIYSIPLLDTFTLYIYSIPLLCTFTLYLYSIPVLYICTLYLYYIPILYTCPLYLYSVPSTDSITMHRTAPLALVLCTFGRFFRTCIPTSFLTLPLYLLYINLCSFQCALCCV